MATAKLIGNSNADTGGGLNLNYIGMCKFTAEATGKVSEIKVYCSVGGNAKVAIYADAGGAPGDKITGNDSDQACVSGLNTLSIGETNLVSGTDYWLAIIADTTGIIRRVSTTGGALKYKAQTYSGFTWPSSAGGGFTDSAFIIAISGWGVLVVSPSGLSQPLAYGTPQLGLSIKPAGCEQVIAYGTPTVQTAALIIYPPGLAVIVDYGAPALLYPQTISPAGLAVVLAFGTPSIGELGRISPPGLSVVIAYGNPTILKYVWHVVLDGQYLTETPEINRAFVIGRDAYGNPVWGEAQDSTEIGLVGERLDFQQELAIPTTAQATSTADAILSKMRLTTKRGVILIPPNCGQELFDTVELSDAGANQSAVKFRVVGIRFEYSPKQARYEHRLILGAP